MGRAAVPGGESLSACKVAWKMVEVEACAERVLMYIVCDFLKVLRCVGFEAKSRITVQCAGEVVVIDAIVERSGNKQGAVFGIISPDRSAIEIGIVQGLFVSTSLGTKHLASTANTQKCLKACKCPLQS